MNEFIIYHNSCGFILYCFTNKLVNKWFQLNIIVNVGNKANLLNFYIVYRHLRKIRLASTIN